MALIGQEPGRAGGGSRDFWDPGTHTELGLYPSTNRQSAWASFTTENRPQQLAATRNNMFLAPHSPYPMFSMFTINTMRRTLIDRDGYRVESSRVTELSNPNRVEVPFDS